MKFSLATAVLCTLFVAKVQAQCTCTTADWTCIQNCCGLLTSFIVGTFSSIAILVSAANTCFGSCTDDTCRSNCFNSNWSGITSVANAVQATASAASATLATDSVASIATASIATASIATASSVSALTTESASTASDSSSSASVLSTASSSVMSSVMSSVISSSIASSSVSASSAKPTIPSSAPAAASVTPAKPTSSTSAGVSDFSHGKVLGAVFVLACSTLFAYL
ncbi:hypothetical protein BC938DRAFT_477698 [Jimgerdemannia flammicorona]|uniref:Extracellular membrane protein CFEM domain-containing protein n=1 Tax=Jimgerdemannia flammicorona TaxID=994334 RepID=A0A433QNZ1_9FUNG|nr:hypothetical protein BC938DRAFT_477698 [Jimgerdemannia flammicorona]